MAEESAVGAATTTDSTDSQERNPRKIDLFDESKLEVPKDESNIFDLTWYQGKCLLNAFKRAFKKDHSTTYEKHKYQIKNCRFKEIYRYAVIGWHTLMVFHPDGKCCLWDVSEKSVERHKKENESLHKQFKEYWADQIKKKSPPRTNKVFIAHGRDHEDRDYIAGMLYEWGLEPIILGFTSVEGSPNVLTALTRLVQDVDFGIVVETPDEADGKLRDDGVDDALPSALDGSIAQDEVLIHALMDTKMKKKERRAIIKKILKHTDTLKRYKKEHDKKDKKKQDPSSLTARPNVLFELGMLIGNFGDDNVVRLRKREKNFSMPSDLEGVLRIEYDAIDSRDVMYQLWEKLVGRGFVVKRFDMAGRNKASIVEKFHSRQEGVIMPGEKIGKNKAYF